MKSKNGIVDYAEYYNFPENVIGNYKATCVICCKPVGCSNKTKSNLLRHLRVS